MTNIKNIKKFMLMVNPRYYYWNVNIWCNYFIFSSY